MRLSSLLAAGLLALAAPAHEAAAQSGESVLKVMDGIASSNVRVAMNRAVVMESEMPFAELSVANPGIADIATLSDRTVYILGKAPGRTTLTLLGPGGTLITNVEVQVVPDIAEFKERLREILPDETIEVRTANDGIVLSGQVTGMQKLARALELGERYAPGRVTNLMTVGGTQQVMLKVRFAEMSRSAAKNLSASLGYNTGGNNMINAGATGTIGTDNNVQDILNISSATFTSTASRQGVFAFGLGAGGVGAAVLIEALESKGLVRTLAEPNLVALSGEEASFLAGGEYPIPVNNNGSVSVEYKEFGINLKFIPTVVDGNLINLRLRAEVSSIDPTVTVTTNGFSVSAFKTRNAETAVEMRDGQSFAIAGLLEDDFQDAVSAVPWLSDLPILGALFRSTNYARRQSELVIIISAHLVTPTRGEALALPTDRVRIPTEAELFLFGKPNGKNFKKNNPAAEVASQNFTSSFGYVME